MGMKMQRVRLFIISAFALFSANTFSQVNYNAEIGVSGGGSYYLGDANSQLFNNMQQAYSGFFRYNLNSRLALKAEFTKVNQIVGPNNSFVNKTVNIGDLCAEFNFFDLEINESNRFGKKFSPFIFTGIGIMTDVYANQKAPEACLPFGVGIKLKLAERWNFSVQWSNRLLFSDNLEDNPKYNNSDNLNGSNVFNNDLLSTITVGISFNFWEKRCNCLNNTLK